ncbi:2OG-Fe(II) oxygenase [Pseudomonas sp. 148P]|uniref:2OG-Fe(II) oxygenase n=1 Tax=Pseudomonas ulcerans TaxID=3115852 RepID=A0ABU7I009_9PSED|nr:MULTISPECIES: 2OG-Fe(II) oxygenase [unclassified Pseudomonas]MEE1925797.1 2OG-Fe(II) oxygenase [Pseudomonas sp. 147P]MEE1937129.1 2OG-Fe(II) oxygenase [Pseudomonas sp. 148P]
MQTSLQLAFPATPAEPDWPALHQSLNQFGYARLPALLDAGQCRELAGLYRQDALFRSRIVMARHGFGLGEYQYFRYPLPDLVEGLRQRFYPCLAALANDWYARLDKPTRFPATLASFLAQCHAAGQLRPTPLLLQYQAGDYNCLHQDLYGDLHFPVQMAILLSRPGIDFEGGEFCLTEYSSREHRAEVVPLEQGDALLFAVAERPVPGRRNGSRKVLMRHGVSRVLAGHRHTLGVIFHDAR